MIQEVAYSSLKNSIRWFLTETMVNDHISRKPSGGIFSANGKGADSWFFETFLPAQFLLPFWTSTSTSLYLFRWRIKSCRKACGLYGLWPKLISYFDFSFTILAKIQLKRDVISTVLHQLKFFFSYIFDNHVFIANDYRFSSRSDTNPFYRHH